MTSYEKREIEITKQKKAAQYKREKKSRFHENIIAAKEKARLLKDGIAIKPGVEAFCMNCKSIVKPLELTHIDIEPWVKCPHCR